MPPIISFLDFTSSSPPVSSSPLQEMTWALTSSSGSGAVSSTGLEIISTTKTNQLQIGIGPRFWNGSEAVNDGATSVGGGKYSFPNGTVGKAWWLDNYQARIRQNGRDWMITDDQNNLGTIYWSGPMTQYNNIGGGAGTNLWGKWWIPQAQGQTIDIEIYDKGNLPDNWDAYADGQYIGEGSTDQTAMTTIESPTTHFEIKRMDGLSNNRFRLWEPNGSGGIQYPATASTCPPYIAVFFDGSWGVYMWTTDGTSPPPGDTGSSNRYWYHDGTNHVEQDVASEGATIVSLTQYNDDVADWDAPYGSIIDWDTNTAPIIGHYASNAASATGQSTDVSYNPYTGVLDQYAQTGTPSVEPTKIGWSSSSAISLPMTNTINTTNFAAGLPYCAYYCSTQNKWSKGTASDRGAFKADMVYTIDRPLIFSNLDDPPACVLLYEVDPGDVSKWRPYDGPTS